MKRWCLLVLFAYSAYAKEIALTFDDAPVPDSLTFSSLQRTSTLIEKLKELEVPPVMIFANGCKRADTTSVISQLKQYVDAGHIIANHTCTHPRFDEIGFEQFSANTAKNEDLLKPLFAGKKFFRYPFLNEGIELSERDKMRAWLRVNHYQHGMVSVDNDDYYFSSRLNQAKKLKRKIDLPKFEAIFLEHVLGAVEFYDQLAMETLNRSPKHVLLLHEQDVTVMFLSSLVSELRRRGWKIIPATDAYQDPLYQMNSANTYGNNGIVAQVHFEKTGNKKNYDGFRVAKKKLDELLQLK